MMRPLAASDCLVIRPPHAPAAAGRQRGADHPVPRRRAGRCRRVSRPAGDLVFRGRAGAFPPRPGSQEIAAHLQVITRGGSSCIDAAWFSGRACTRPAPAPQKGRYPIVNPTIPKRCRAVQRPPLFRLRQIPAEDLPKPSRKNHQFPEADDRKPHRGIRQLRPPRAMPGCRVARPAPLSAVPTGILSEGGTPSERMRKTRHKFAMLHARCRTRRIAHRSMQRRASQHYSR